MNTCFAQLPLGGGEIILILALILILFGAKRLPEMAKGLGQEPFDWARWGNAIGITLAVLLTLVLIGILALGRGLL